MIRDDRPAKRLYLEWVHCFESRLGDYTALRRAVPPAYFSDLRALLERQPNEPPVDLRIPGPFTRLYDATDERIAVLDCQLLAIQRSDMRRFRELGDRLCGWDCDSALFEIHVIGQLLTSLPWGRVDISPELPGDKHPDARVSVSKADVVIEAVHIGWSKYTQDKFRPQAAMWISPYDETNRALRKIIHKTGQLNTDGPNMVFLNFQPLPPDPSDFLLRFALPDLFSGRAWHRTLPQPVVDKAQEGLARVSSLSVVRRHSYHLCVNRGAAFPLSEDCSRMLIETVYPGTGCEYHEF